MKKKTGKNYSGIVICDSITMSVKKKTRNFRKPESAAIAVIGFISVIMSFLDMFDFSYNRTAVIQAAVIFSAVHIAIAFAGKKTLWLAGGSALILAAALYKFIGTVSDGFKYVYNVIYRTAHHNQVSYYKLLDPDDESRCITFFFIFSIWLLAIVIYTFTIHRPNPLIVVVFTFPIIEIGLYNGINIPVFWGILTVAYWFAVTAVFSIDVGEYYGGNGGFVRKNDTFFPKRQMRLKVTEKCALILIFTITFVAALSLAVMNLTDYKRSDSLNQKRIDIKEAVNSFTLDDFAASVSDITKAFGFTFSYESHKLGNIDHIKYKNVTDLTATFDKKYDGAIYLKGFAGAVYGNNEWTQLKNSVYKKNSGIFDNFKKYGIYPQDFPHIFYQSVFPQNSDITLWIDAKRKKNKSYAPYATNNYGDMEYQNDALVSSKNEKSSTYSYKFTGIDALLAGQLLDSETEIKNSISSIADETWQRQTEEYCSEHSTGSSDEYTLYTSLNNSMTDGSFLTDGKFVMAALLENSYRSFVYDNYLQVPDNKNMNEVRDAFSDILEYAQTADTAGEKLAVLDALRERICTMADYTTSPGETPSNRDFVNYFLLENHKGYCTHYATAGVILARMAGIPARYATGYIVVSDDFSSSTENSDGTYTINVQDNRSHAWAEVYLDGFGWVPFEFTEGYSSSNINVTTAEMTTENQTTTVTTSADSSESETKTSKSKTHSSDSNTTAPPATSTTVSSNAAVNHVNNVSDNSDAKTIYAIAAIIISLILLIYLRKCIIIRCRKKHFTSGANNERIIYMYNYVEKLLALIKINRANMMYSEFAEYVEDELSPEYFARGKFEEFMNAALKSSFGYGIQNIETTARALDFTKDMKRAVYERSGLLKKLYMKLILVL